VSQVTDHRPIRTYRRPLGNGWWLRRRSYFLYMVREFTVVLMAAWLIWFLY
jgi:fumarate reductase subunit C